MLVGLTVKLFDETSRGLIKIGAGLKDVGKLRTAFNSASEGAGKTSSKVEELLGNINQSVKEAGLLSAAFGAVSNGVGNAVNAIRSGVDESAALQLSNLTTASGFAAQTGMTFDKAGEFIDDMNLKLSITAAALPGATSDYTSLGRSIIDNVIPAFKSANGEINFDGLKTEMLSITESFGALAAGAGIDTANAGQGISKLLSGASTSALMENAFFAASPALMTFFDDKLKELGVESFKDIDIKQRVAIIKEAGLKHITAEFKDAATKSVTGLNEGFKSALFDPLSGIFGMSKDLDKIKKGQQTAFNAYGEALAEVIGPGGLFFQIGDTLKAAGIELADPMVVLKSGFDTLTVGLKKVNTFLTTAQEFLKTGTDLSGVARYALFLTGFKPLAFLDTIFDTLPDLIARGGLIVDGAIASIMPLVGQIIPRITPLILRFFSGVTTVMPLLFGSIANRVASIIPMLAPLFNQGVALVGQIVAQTNWGDLGVSLGASVGRMVGAVIEFLGKVDYASLLVTIGNVALAVIGAIAGFIGGMALGALPGIGRAFKSIGGAIVDGFNTLVLAIVQTVKDFMGSIPGQLVANFIPGGGTVSAATGIAQAVDSRNALNNVTTMPAPTSRPMALGSRFDGQIPSAAGGLLGAAQKEVSAMPSGAELVVANSKEFILKPAGRKAGGGGGNTFNFTVNGINDPIVFVDKVIAEMQNRFSLQMESALD